VLLPEWVQRRLEASRSEPEPERSPSVLAAPLDRLPVPRRRVSVWRATILGTCLFGIGIAATFRTKADIVIGIALSVPLLVATGMSSTGDAASSSGETDPPAWGLGVIYGTLAVTGAYSYLRASSWNRRLDATVPPGPERSTRTAILERELQLLAADRWRVASRGEFEAIVLRQKRPNHWLHLGLTFMTLYIWAYWWYKKTRASQRDPQPEYRRVSVDDQGNWSVEPWQPAIGAPAMR
jgi:hypothetical protein